MLANGQNGKSGHWGRAAILEVKSLGADYRGTPVFSDSSFVVQRGETLAVLGKSGSGKSTLLRAIAGLYGDDMNVRGDVLLDGMSMQSDQKIGIVFQDALVFPRMTAWENVLFGRTARTNPQYAFDLLVSFGISNVATQLADTLSGGQRQRLALACALANSPQVLLLDEPFGALDAITRGQLQVQFAQNIRGKVTCIFVTHDIAEAVEIASQRVMIGIGRQAQIIDLPQWPVEARPRSSLKEFGDISRDLHVTLAEYGI